MRGFLSRLLRLVGGWLDELFSIEKLFQGIWEVAGLFLESIWGPITLVLVVVGVLTVTPRLRRWLRRRLTSQAQVTRSSLVPHAPLPSPISSVRSRVVGGWLATSTIVGIGTFLLISESRDTIVGRIVFSLILAGITFIGFWANYTLSGGTWHLRFDEEGVHAGAGRKRRSVKWQDVGEVGVKGHRLRISPRDHGTDLVCWGLPKGVPRRVAGQIRECLGTLEPPYGITPEDT